MKTKSLVLLLGVAMHLCSPVLCAESTTGAETLPCGPDATSNWRSDDFKGAAFREWDAAGRTFSFDWKTETGDQIGRIGVSYGSSRLGVRMGDLRPDCVMSTDAAYTPAVDAWFYWTIYGWTHPEYTYWGHTPKGWNNEFYIVMHTGKTREAFLADPGCVDIGSVNVDGEVFDCYNVPRPSQSQWLAVRRSQTWSGAVNLRKIFDYWRSKGMANEYVVDLGWAVEGFNGSAGKMVLTNINTPDLTLPATATR